MSLVLRNKGNGMQRSSEQPLVGEERYVTTLITAARETTNTRDLCKSFDNRHPLFYNINIHHYLQFAKSSSFDNFKPSSIGES